MTSRNRRCYELPTDDGDVVVIPPGLRIYDRKAVSRLEVKRLVAMAYVRQSPRCLQNRLLSIVTMRRPVKVDQANRAALRRQIETEDMVREAIQRADEICDATVSDLKHLVADPDTSPMVALLAGFALESRA